MILFTYRGWVWVIAITLGLLFWYGFYHLVTWVADVIGSYW